ncbi:MAG: hypothetical protein NTY77_13135 [Elusimicrobia bacterium]|nr:hypothetical protein [Elusimicrobiota bacterium]
MSGLLAAVLGLCALGSFAQQPQAAAVGPAARARSLAVAAESFVPRLEELGRRSWKAGFKGGQLDDDLWQLARQIRRHRQEVQALAREAKDLKPEDAPELLKAAAALREKSVSLQSAAERGFEKDFRPHGFTHQGWNIKREASRSCKAAEEIEASVEPRSNKALRL